MTGASDDKTLSIASVQSSFSTIGPFRLVQMVGTGGMGEVWRAEQTAPFHRTVALKLIKAGMDTRAVVARFESERQALALMEHPNIAKVFDAGATPEGRPYFVMEYVPGLSVTSYCDKHRLSIRDASGGRRTHQRRLGRCRGRRLSPGHSAALSMGSFGTSGGFGHSSSDCFSSIRRDVEIYFKPLSTCEAQVGQVVSDFDLLKQSPCDGTKVSLRWRELSVTQQRTRNIQGALRLPDVEEGAGPERLNRDSLPL